MRNWFKPIEQNAMNDICKVLVGSNCDRVNRKVSKDKGRALVE